ncbi:MAG: diguanylate cyclase [Beijerinckiaceae bacterium]
MPLPLAMLDHSGRAVLLNAPFRQRYDVDVLTSHAVKEAVAGAGSGWKKIRIQALEGGVVERRAQALDLEGGPLLVLDEPAESETLRALDRLETQIASLRRVCSTDPLTGIWNRTHFERIITGELDRSVRHRQPVSLLLVDIDGFKAINDSFGHQAGDAVLMELVGVLQSTVRSIDMLFRWGGEEFVIVAPSTAYRGAALFGERIRRAVEAHEFGFVGHATVSIGIAEHAMPETASMWFRRADEAMYRAKAGGRNQVSFEPLGSSNAWTKASGASAIRLVWRDEYECGEPLIDEQHRQLFDLANDALEASLQPNPSNEFEAAIGRLLTHITEHFAYEEQALAESGYEELDEHKTAHAALLRRAASLRLEVAAGQATFAELVAFLADKVVAQHLFTVDRKFYPLFAAGR